VFFLTIACLLIKINSAGANSHSKEANAQKSEIEKIVEDIVTNAKTGNPGAKNTLQGQHNAQDLRTDDFIKTHSPQLFESSSPRLGRKGEKNRLVAFMDPSCGYCQKFLEELKALAKERRDIDIIIKDIPLLPNSRGLVKDLLAAHKQGKYFELLGVIHRASGRTSMREREALAGMIGLNIHHLREARESRDIHKSLAQNEALRAGLDIQGTPTFILNGKKYQGSVTRSELNRLIEDPRSRH